MERTSPPFRADHVGSLLRPAWLIEARKGFNAGKISHEALHKEEDRAVGDVVAMQEEIGLHSITDGEFRRQTYLSEFLNPIGVELQPEKSDDLVYHDDRGGTVPATKAVVNRRIEWKSSINGDGFTFLKSLTRATPKVTLPAPTQVHFFAGTTGISKTVYPDIEQFWDDMVAAYRAELQALGEAGCTYFQIDETCLPKLAAPSFSKWSPAAATIGARSRGNMRTSSTGSSPVRRPGCTSPFIIAAATMPVCGKRRQAMTPSPKSSSTKSRRPPICSNMIRRVPATSRPCASCRRTRPSSSAWSRPRTHRNRRRAQIAYRRREPLRATRPPLPRTAMRFFLRLHGLTHDVRKPDAEIAADRRGRARRLERLKSRLELLRRL